MGIEREVTSVEGGVTIFRKSPWIGLTLEDISRQYKVIITGYRNNSNGNCKLKKYNSAVKIYPYIYISFMGSAESVSNLFAAHAIKN